MPRHIQYRSTHLVNLLSPVEACLCVPKHSSCSLTLHTVTSPLQLPDTDTRISLIGCSELPGSPNQAGLLCRHHGLAPLLSSPISSYSLPHPLYSRHTGLFAAWLFWEHTGYAPASEPLQLLILLLRTFFPQTPSWLVPPLSSDLCSNVTFSVRSVLATPSDMQTPTYGPFPPSLFSTLYHHLITLCN